MNILGCRIGFVPLVTHGAYLNDRVSRERPARLGSAPIIGCVMSYIDGRRFESANLLDSRSTGPDGNSSPISPSVKWHFARSDSIPS